MTPEVEEAIRGHSLSDASFVHTNLVSTECDCFRVPAQVVAAPPRSSGNSCFVCGGITVQTGTCTTCTSCGTTGGCG